MSDRIEVFKQMLESDPGNTMVMFGLANEYQKAGMVPETIAILVQYLELADDEGAAWGMLARAYESEGNSGKAKEAYEKGIEASLAHGHPSMAEDFRFALDSDY